MVHLYANLKCLFTCYKDRKGSTKEEYGVIRDCYGSLKLNGNVTI